MKDNKNLKLNKHSTLKMTPYLTSVIQKVSREKESSQSPVFKNHKDTIKWLDSQK